MLNTDGWTYLVCTVSTSPNGANKPPSCFAQLLGSRQTTSPLLGDWSLSLPSDVCYCSMSFSTPITHKKHFPIKKTKRNKKRKEIRAARSVITTVLCLLTDVSIDLIHLLPLLYPFFSLQRARVCVLSSNPKPRPVSTPTPWVWVWFFFPPFLPPPPCSLATALGRYCFGCLVLYVALRPLGVSAIERLRVSHESSQAGDETGKMAEHKKCCFSGCTRVPPCRVFPSRDLTKETMLMAKQSIFSTLPASYILSGGTLFKGQYLMTCRAGLASIPCKP